MPSRPSPRHRLRVIAVSLVASASLAACSGSSGGSDPTDSSSPDDTSSSPHASSSTKAGPDTPLGHETMLRAVIGKARARDALPRIRSLPGVTGATYAAYRTVMRVYLSADITVAQRNRVVQALGRAANG